MYDTPFYQVWKDATKDLSKDDMVAFTFYCWNESLMPNRGALREFLKSRQK